MKMNEPLDWDCKVLELRSSQIPVELHFKCLFKNFPKGIKRYSLSGHSNQYETIYITFELLACEDIKFTDRLVKKNEVFHMTLPETALHTAWRTFSPKIVFNGGTKDVYIRLHRVTTKKFLITEVEEKR